MNNDRVTWLLPVKDGMPYLPETLASIEAQTYKNWEVLVWDNGSTDNTIEELKKWIPSRLAGRLITGEPLTLGGSLARMVEICETELCARIDADDINLPERLEKQLDFLSDRPDISVLGSWMYFIDEQGVQKKDLYTIPLEHDDIVHEMLTRNAIAHPSVLFKRSTILQVGNYRDQYRDQVNIEDYDLWLRVSQQFKLANLDTPLVKYRIHKNSTTQLAIKENRINKAMNDCICENSPLTFGCSESDMRLLQERNHPFAFQPILQIAKHLQKSQRSFSINTLISESFIRSTKKLISPKDLLSWLLLIAYHPNKYILYQQIKKMTKPVLKKVIDANRIISKFNRYYSRKKWLKKCKLQGSIIHPSITLIGIKNPFDYINISQCVIEPEMTLWLSPDQGAEVKFSVGKRSYIGRNTFIGVFKPISIGECVLIGAYCYIISANHNYETCSIPIIDQGFVGAPVTIEDDVWIGTHVVILPNVTIGKGAVIAAHSLVNKNIPPYEVWGGIPAKFLKKRI